MPDRNKLKLNRPPKQDALVWELTILARRAVKRAVKTERFGNRKTKQLGRRLSSSTDKESSLRPLCNTISVSQDSLSMKYGAGIQLPVGARPNIKPQHSTSFRQTSEVTVTDSLVNKLKSSPFYLERRPSDNNRLSGPPKDIERTGPTSWSIEDLRGKYRDEFTRNDAYQGSLKAQTHQIELSRRNLVVSAVQIGNHPIHMLCHQLMETAHTMCLGRARTWSTTRRFVLDVHQIWLANLDHLEAANRGVVLRHRRVDGHAILTVKSQIQSIAVQHSWCCQKKLQPPMPTPLARLGYAGLPLMAPSILEQSLSAVPLISSETIEVGDVAYLVSVVRQFCPRCDQRPMWHIYFYDPFAGTGAGFLASENALLRIAASMSMSKPLAWIQPASCRLLHTQGCQIQEPFFGPIASICHIFTCAEKGVDQPRQVAYFDFEFLTNSGQPFQIWRMRLDAHDVIAQLGLSHGTCIAGHWWHQRGQASLFARFLNQFVWNGNKLVLQIPSVSSSLAWGFDFKRTAAQALGLLGVFAFEMSSLGQEDIYESSEKVSDDEECKTIRDLLKISALHDPYQARSLSLYVNGVRDRVLDVPGTTAIELTGIPFASDDQAECRTEAVATLHHEYDLLKGVLINVIRGLDLVISAPKQLTWDNANLNPPGIFKLPTVFYIPLVQTCFRNYASKFNSIVTWKVSRHIFAVTAARFNLGGDTIDDWKQIDECGFRLTSSCILLEPNYIMNPKIFSLTHSCATPNKGSLTGRSTRHSDERCWSILSRARVIEDHVHMLRKTKHQGSNDPGVYTVSLRHICFSALRRGGLAASVKQMLVEQQHCEIRERKRRLEEKISKGKELLAEKCLLRTKRVSENTHKKGENSGGVARQYEGEAASGMSSKPMDYKKQMITLKSAISNLARKLEISQLHVLRSANNHGEKRKTLEHSARPAKDFTLDQPLYSQGFPQLAMKPMQNAAFKGELAWRRLHRNIKSKSTRRPLFIEARIQGAIDSMVNTAAQPIIVGMVHPGSGIDYDSTEPSTTTDDCILITELLEATVRTLEQQKRIVPDTDMSAHDRLLAQSGKATTTVADQVAELETLAFVRCTLGHTDSVEECLDQEVAIENRDGHGNTLAIIAAQQNNKKMLKMLLRRGADINAQNSTGNTALHYTHEYKFHALAEYILNKGGDDTLLNIKGLTCYEGVGAVH